jgi:hypothetical protein
VEEIILPWSTYIGIGTVEALKISELLQTGRLDNERTTRISFAKRTNETLMVKQTFIDKHKPKVGDYVVRIKDKWMICMPSNIFEDLFHQVSI